MVGGINDVVYQRPKISRLILREFQETMSKKRKKKMIERKDFCRVERDAAGSTSVMVDYKEDSLSLSMRMQRLLKQKRSRWVDKWAEYACIEHQSRNAMY